MHIVHLNFSISIGGIDTMLVDILNEQVKVAQTSLIVINDQVDDRVLANLDPKVNLVKLKRKKGSFNVFKLIELNRLLIKMKPSVLHCHNANVAKYIWFCRAPKVLTVHDMGYTDKEYRRYGKIFAISKAVKADIEKRGKYPVEVVYNGVKPLAIKRSKDSKEEGLFKMAVISRLEHEKKGQDLVLQALASLKKCTNLSLIVDFYGDGKSKEFLINMSVELGLNKEARFLGSKPRGFVYQHLCEYDLLIQPSRYEGFGLTIVEGMLAEVPVLASNIDGPIEILANGKYGFTFEVGEKEDLEQKILELIEQKVNNPEKLKNDLEQARNYALKEFSIESTVKNYLGEYNKLIK